MNIRATPGEMEKLGRAVAGKLNMSRGPVYFLLPLRGWSIVGGPGGPLYDPESNQAFVTALTTHLDPKVQVIQMDTVINDPAVADRAVELLHEEFRRQSR
jgi:uncharacterized protein (UPF0261 family)